MYFDVSPGAIENILRYTSARPNSGDWTRLDAIHICMKKPLKTAILTGMFGKSIKTLEFRHSLTRELGLAVTMHWDYVRQLSVGQMKVDDARRRVQLSFAARPYLGLYNHIPSRSILL